MLDKIVLNDILYRIDNDIGIDIFRLFLYYHYQILLYLQEKKEVPKRKY